MNSEKNISDYQIIEVFEKFDGLNWEENNDLIYDDLGELLNEIRNNDYDVVLVDDEKKEIFIVPNQISKSYAIGGDEIKELINYDI